MSLGNMVVIQTHKYGRNESKEYLLIRSKIDSRRRLAGQLYYELSKFLFSLPNCNGRIGLLNLANELSKQINVNLDRSAKRQTEGLICWFCENWNFLNDKLNDAYRNLYQINRTIKIPDNISILTNKNSNKNRDMIDSCNYNDNDEDCFDYFINVES